LIFLHICIILIIHNSFIKYLKSAFIAEIRGEFHKLKIFDFSADNGAA